MPEEKQETTLVVRSPEQLQPKTEQSAKMMLLDAFTPKSLSEAMQLAKMIAGSELAPKDYRGKPANCLIGMQYCAELGVPLFSGLQNISIINGRASVWGDLALALVQRHPDYVSHDEHFEGEGEKFAAVFTIERKGQKPYVFRFSVMDAKTAKLWGKRGNNGQDTPWITNPKRMLQMRARGFGLRDKFADALKGLILAEEAMDLPPVTQKTSGEVPADLSSIATITQSAEPNRGHGNEGMQVGEPPAPAKADSQDQTVKKQEDWICNECGEKNSHKKDCSHCAAWLASLKKGSGTSAEAKPTQTPTDKPEGAHKSFQHVACVLQSVNKRQKKPLRTITVLSNDGEWSMSVWHEHLYPILDPLPQGTQCIFEYSSKKDKDGREWTSLEHVLEIAGQKYADDKPVEVVEGELSGEQIGFPKETVDDVEIPE